MNPSIRDVSWSCSWVLDIYHEFFFCSKESKLKYNRYILQDWTDSTELNRLLNKVFTRINGYNYVGYFLDIVNEFEMRTNTVPIDWSNFFSMQEYPDNITNMIIDRCLRARSTYRRGLYLIVEDSETRETKYVFVCWVPWPTEEGYFIINGILYSGVKLLTKSNCVYLKSYLGFQSSCWRKDYRGILFYCNNLISLPVYDKTCFLYSFCSYSFGDYVYYEGRNFSFSSVLGLDYYFVFSLNYNSILGFIYYCFTFWCLVFARSFCSFFISLNSFRGLEVVSLGFFIKLSLNQIKFATLILFQIVSLSLVGKEIGNSIRWLFVYILRVFLGYLRIGFRLNLFCSKSLVFLGMNYVAKIYLDTIYNLNKGLFFYSILIDRWLNNYWPEELNFIWIVKGLYTRESKVDSISLGNRRITNLWDMLLLSDLENHIGSLDVFISLFESRWVTLFIDSSMSFLNYLMDTNKLRIFESKNKLNSLSFFGLGNDDVQVELWERDLHTSYYNRLCVVSTPDGKKVGLNVYQVFGSRISTLNLMEVSYLELNGDYFLKLFFFNYLDESLILKVVKSDLLVKKDSLVAYSFVVLKEGSKWTRQFLNCSFFFDLMEDNIFSLSAKLIPFVYNTDLNRAQMGGKMQMQSVHLLYPQIAYVNLWNFKVLDQNINNWISCLFSLTNVFYTYKLDLGSLTRVDTMGIPGIFSGLSTVSTVTWDFVSQSQDLSFYRYFLHYNYLGFESVYTISNEFLNGLYSLGTPLLSAYLSLGGSTFEDSIVVSSDLVRFDKFSSLHLFVLVYLDYFHMKYVLSDFLYIGAYLGKGIHWINPRHSLVLKEDCLVVDILYESLVVMSYLKKKEWIPFFIGSYSFILLFYYLEVCAISSCLKLWLIEVFSELYCNACLSLYYKWFLNKLCLSVYSFYLYFIFLLYYLCYWDLIQLIWRVKENNFYFLFFCFILFISNLGVVFYFDLFWLIISFLFIVFFSFYHCIYFFRLSRFFASMNVLPSRSQYFFVSKWKIKYGDKLSGKYGNKGVVSQIFPSKYMPMMRDGTKLDIILNPFGVSSRINISQLKESVLGLCIQLFDIFYGLSVWGFLESRERWSLMVDKLQIISHIDGWGKYSIIDLYGGVGELDRVISMGILQFMKLEHFSAKKRLLRSWGPYKKDFFQPTKGKKNLGGQKLGEMEGWALFSYGASYLLSDNYSVKSNINMEYSLLRLGNSYEGRQYGVSLSFLLLLERFWMQSISVDSFISC